MRANRRTRAIRRSRGCRRTIRPAGSTLRDFGSAPAKGPDTIRSTTRRSEDAETAIAAREKRRTDPNRPRSAHFCSPCESISNRETFGISEMRFQFRPVFGAHVETKFFKRHARSDRGFTAKVRQRCRVNGGETAVEDKSERIEVGLLLLPAFSEFREQGLFTLDIRIVARRRSSAILAGHEQADPA